MLEFASIEDMQAHYRTVRQRIQNSPPKLKFRPVEPVKAPAPLPPVQTHQQILPAAKKTGLAGTWDEYGQVVHKKEGVASVAGEEETPANLPKIWLEELTSLVSNYTHMSPTTIWSRRRDRDVVCARFLIWALAREFCYQHSLPTIGRYCGRDHTTILHGAARGKKLPAYPELVRQVKAILEVRVGEPKS